MPGRHTPDEVSSPGSSVSSGFVHSMHGYASMLRLRAGRSDTDATSGAATMVPVQKPPTTPSKPAEEQPGLSSLHARWAQGVPPARSTSRFDLVLRP